MGVPGLWELLRPAAARTSLSILARDALLVNRHGLRALTIGIDASIWIFHAQVPVRGENPFLRTIFYKVAALLQQPVLPVFVFDGPRKPSQKRNRQVVGHFGTADQDSRQFKALLNECGLEWWNAPGEAEAELAVMNRQGKIDAVLSDDVDALLFGATCLMRNNSSTLSQAQGTLLPKGEYEVFQSSAIRKHWSETEGTKLVTEEDCRMAMILIAMLAGGDYAPQGLEGFGPTIAFALAHAGFADFLKLHISDPAAFQVELSFMHGKMVDELRSNSTGHIGRKLNVLADRLAAFDLTSVFTPTSLDAYLRPAASPVHDVEQGWPGFGKGHTTDRRGKARNEGRGDLEGFATACETYFEWGTRERVTAKFMGEQVGLFGSDIMHTARESLQRRDREVSSRSKRSPSRSRAVRASNTGPSPPSDAVNRITSFFGAALPRTSTSKSASASNSAPNSASVSSTPRYVVDIQRDRTNPSTPSLVEYRIGYKTQPFVDRVHTAMQGTRPDPRDLPSDERERLGLVGKPEAAAASQSEGEHLQETARVWVPEYLVREAWPNLVHEYEERIRSRAVAETRKAEKRNGTGMATKRTPKITTIAMDSTAFKGFFVPSQPAKKQNAVSRTVDSSEEEIEEIEVIEDMPRRRRNKEPLLAKYDTGLDHLSSSSLSSLPSSPASTPRIAASDAGSPSKRGRPNSTSASSETQSSRASPQPVVASHQVQVRQKAVRSATSRRSSSVVDASGLEASLQPSNRPSEQVTTTGARTRRPSKRVTVGVSPSDNAQPSPLISATKSSSRSVASARSKSVSKSPSATPPASAIPPTVRHRRIAVLISPSKTPRTRAARPSPAKRPSPRRQMSTVSPAGSGEGGKDAPIDLCSSNEDTPKASRVARTSAKKTSSKAKHKDGGGAEQTILDFAVTAHMGVSSRVSGKSDSPRRSGNSASAGSVGATGSVGPVAATVPLWEEERWAKAMNRGFVVVEDTEEGEWIDCTRSR